jgi:hypothetical protein
MSNFKYWRQGNTRYERLIGYKLSNCDFMMSLVHRVILPLQALVQASSFERDVLLATKPPRPMACWPDGVLDDFRRIDDWDEVFRTAHDLWQATNCVSLFATDIEAAQSSAAIVLTLMACESVMGLSIKANGYALELELANRLRLGLTGCRFRRSELERFVLSWSTSIAELGLPVPSVKPSKRSSMIGVGDSGWGSDKRRGIPRKVILPLAIKAVAANWKQIKKVRLARPGILPLDEECLLARRMFAGHNIDRQLADALAKTADPLLPSHDSDWGNESDTESDDSFASPSEVGFHNYSGDYGSFINPKYLPKESTASQMNRRFWRNANKQAVSEATAASAVPPPPRALGVERTQSTINKPDMIQAWIENGDASSSDEPDSSDEDVPTESSRPTKRAKGGLDVSHIGELPQPFAFSIGREGFMVDRAQTPSLPTPAPTPGPDSSSAGPSRAQSVETIRSDSGLTAASDSCQMVRQLSATPSATSTATTSIARRPAPLRATLTPAPVTSTNGALPSARAEREAIRRGRRHLNDHTGVLIREKKEYFNIGRTFETLRHATEQPADTDVIKSINLWLERKKPLARNPPLPDGRYSTDLRIMVKAHAPRQSPIETLLRAGVGPSRIPHHIIPRSVCATNMDLFHYADRNAIMGIGNVRETEQLLDMSLRLFFRGFGNDTLPEVFLTDEEVQVRIQSYFYKGHWDILADSSPVPIPKFRKRKREVKAVPDNMSQRIASELESGDKSDQETEEIIQQAVLAGLLVVKPLVPWDPFKVSASVPSLWYIDDLFELGLVDRSKLGPQEAWETAESTWARRRKQEARGEVDMPMPAGAGAEWMGKRGCVMVDGIVTRPPGPKQNSASTNTNTQSPAH